MTFNDFKIGDTFKFASPTQEVGVVFRKTESHKQNGPNKIFGVAMVVELTEEARIRYNYHIGEEIAIPIDNEELIAVVS